MNEKTKELVEAAELRAQFDVSARSDVPTLCAIIREQDAEIERLRASLKERDAEIESLQERINSADANACGANLFCEV